MNEGLTFVACPLSILGQLGSKAINSAIGIVRRERVTILAAAYEGI
jgi:hypothetical protein